MPSVTWNWDIIDYRCVTWISTIACLQAVAVLFFNLILYGLIIGEKVVVSPLKVLSVNNNGNWGVWSPTVSESYDSDCGDDLQIKTIHVS